MKDKNSEITNVKNDSKITNIEHKEIFKKREKGETPEEKAERKKKIKTFKNERKEKKKKFKEELKYQQANELKKNVVQFEIFMAKQQRQLELSMMNLLENEDDEISNRKLTRYIEMKKPEKV